jgi:hypothetical protein
MYEQKQKISIKNKKQIKEKHKQQKKRNNTKNSELYISNKRTEATRQERLKIFSHFLKYKTSWFNEPEI